MAGVNQVSVSGRLVRDPELRHSASGTAIYSNAVAHEEYVKDAENHVSFLNFTVFGNYAELLANKTKKGDNIVVAGRLRQRSWEAEDGSKRSAVEIIARDVWGEFQYRKNGENGVQASEGDEAPVDSPGLTPEADEPTPSAQQDEIPF